MRVSFARIYFCDLWHILSSIEKNSIILVIMWSVFSSSLLSNDLITEVIFRHHHFRIDILQGDISGERLMSPLFHGPSLRWSSFRRNQLFNEKKSLEMNSQHQVKCQNVYIHALFNHQRYLWRIYSRNEWRFLTKMTLRVCFYKCKLFWRFKTSSFNVSFAKY